MTNNAVRTKTTGSAFVLLMLGAPLANIAQAQSDMQQRVAEVKMSAAMNKQALAKMTWAEQVTISLKGEQKKVEHFQVRIGPDGKPQKTSLDQAAPPPEQSGRRGRVKEHVVEKKTDEYTQYANQMKDLMQQYLPPDKDLIQQAYGRGGVSVAPGGAPDQVQLVIHNYLKQGDSMTLFVDKEQKNLVQIQIASYMSDPKDAMTASVQFSKVGDGSSQISNVVLNGVSKQLNIAIADSQYRPL
jgi:alkylated DNA repair dioxygenase AlkB